jgi:hypothetical protein
MYYMSIEGTAAFLTHMELMSVQCLCQIIFGNKDDHYPCDKLMKKFEVVGNMKLKGGVIMRTLLKKMSGSI